MTVSSTINRNSYTGNDTTKNFNYSFKIFQESDLEVVVRNTATDEETPLLLATDYTVNDVGEFSGGTIDLVNSGQEWLSLTGNLDIGYVLIVRRLLSLTQETDIRNQGDFYAEVHENVFDKQTMIAQQQQDELDRCVHLPPTVTKEQFDPTIPAGIVGQNGLAMVSNENGDGFDIGPSVSSIEGAVASAAAAAASAAAALVSEGNAATSESNAAASEANAQSSETAASNSAAAAALSAANAATSEGNAATSESNAATSEANAATSEANAAASETNADQSYQDILALLTDISAKETLLNNVTNQDMLVTIDETTHYSGVIEYFAERPSGIEYGRIAIRDNSPFEVIILEKIGNVGLSFGISEAAGIGTLNYSTTDTAAGTLRYKFIKFGV